MKIIITEGQYKRLIETEEQQEVLHIPSIKIFGGDWDLLQKFLKHRGNPPYSIGGNLNLRHTEIESLGNLTSVGGALELQFTPIESLGNLTSVGGDLYLTNSSVTSIGKLSYVGNSLFLFDTPLSKKYTEEEIRQMVNVGGNIHI
jgi:hypothetical protein